MNKPLFRNVVISLITSLAITFATPIAMAADSANDKLKPYLAQYKVFRSGSERGAVEQELIVLDSFYRLRYESHIEWLIFSEDRVETSEFTVSNGQVKPAKYTTERSGTGPDKSFVVVFDQENKTIEQFNPNQKKKSQKATEIIPWNDNYLDSVTYQQQLTFDLQAGKTEFYYHFIDRKGNERKNNFKQIAEEDLTLPYGKVKAIKVARVYDGDSDRQTLMWFAPQLDYALVKMTKIKDDAELFDIQLVSIKY